MKLPVSVSFRIACIGILQNNKSEHVCTVGSAGGPSPPLQMARFGHMTRRSVAEVAKSRLLEVEDVVLESVANAVLALDGVPAGVVSLQPGAPPGGDAGRRSLSQSFELRDGSYSSSSSRGASRLVWRFWIEQAENTSGTVCTVRV